MMGNLKSPSSVSADMDFNPTDPVMKFENRNEAEKLINKIQRSISGIFENAESVMQLGMTEILAVFQNDFKNDVIRVGTNAYGDRIIVHRRCGIRLHRA